MPFPITTAEISKTEAKTGFKFPLGLKSRFSKDNGGELEIGGDCWQLIPFLDTTDRKRRAPKSLARRSISGITRRGSMSRSATLWMQYDRHRQTYGEQAWCRQR